MSNKLNAKKVVVDGYTFDSKKEALRYIELKMLRHTGEIADLVVHPKYPLEVNGNKVCEYWADFEYMDVMAGELVTEDVKGHKGGSIWNLFRVKAKLFAALYGREVRVV